MSLPIRASFTAPPGRGRWVRAWRNVAVFLAALTGVHLLLDAWLPLPDLGKVSEKLAYFEQHKDEFDAVFVGSSRVYRQIAPALFDAQVAAATGQPMRSFNLGAPSMFLPESMFVIDRIVAQRPVRLRWMFIELDDPRPRVEEHAGLVQREVYWHGWRETVLMCFNILTARGIHKGDRMLMLTHQGMLFGRCWTHVGFAQEWLANRIQSKNRTTATIERVTLGPAADGYDPYHGILGQKQSDSKDPEADVKNFLAATRALETGAARAQSPPDASLPLRWLLREKVRALRACGIEPLFVIPPVTTAETEFFALAKQGVLPTLFAFNDPVAYPDLYQVSVRADTAHLNEPGAQMFTRLLAGKFAAHRQDAERTAATASR